MAKSKESKAVPASPDMDKYQMEDDARTLMKAEEIKQDKKRHGAALGHLGKQKRAITSIEGLREAASDMAKKKRMGSMNDHEEE